LGELAVQFGDIAPNPVNNMMRFAVDSKEETDLRLKLFDQYGKLVLQSTQVLNSGKNKLAIPVAQLPNGTYYAKLAANGVSGYKKLVIIH
jgi:Secretion system C-terminal sorting domain